MTIPLVPEFTGPLPSRTGQTQTQFSNNIDQLFQDLPTVVDGWNDAIDATNLAIPQVNADAQTAQTAAGLATAVAGAELWVSGQTYVTGEAAISAIDFQAYRANTGTSGTTDPSASADWTLVTIGAPSPVGFDLVTSASASTTLTSDKTLIVCAPTNYGMTVKMADATTCTVGAEQARIQNDSSYHIRITDNANTLLGFVMANSTVSIVCESISTAAGGWSLLGADTLGISGQIATGANITAGASAENYAIDMDGDIQIVYGYRVADGYAVAAAYRQSTGASGALGVVRAVNLGSESRVMAIRHSDTQMLLVSCTSTTALEAVIVTVDPSTLALTVNAAATATLAGNIIVFPSSCGLVAIPDLPNSFVIAYRRDSTVAGIRAISVSGTTVTIGAETALDGSGGAFIVATGDKVIAASTATTNLYTKPYTISGSSISAGTGTTTSSGTMTINRFFALGTRWCALYTDGSAVRGGIVSLSSTTTTISTAALLASTVFSDAIRISASKVLVMNNANSANMNILTDTSGTASAGTAITVNSNATARFAALCTDNRAVIQEGTTTYLVYTIDCSGASPVYSSTVVTTSSTTNAVVPVLVTSRNNLRLAVTSFSTGSKTTRDGRDVPWRAEFALSGFLAKPRTWVPASSGDPFSCASDQQRWFTNGSDILSLVEYV
jgi:hypothetical protein